MSRFMLHRKILIQCGGDLERNFIRRTTEKSSAEDIIDISEEVATRTRTGSSRINLKTRFNKPWKDSGEKNPKGNYTHMKYESADKIRKCHICQSTKNLANNFPKRGKIDEIDIEKDDLNKENSDYKSSTFSYNSKDIENINVTFDIMESYSHVP
ncbi:hypothetical protein O181_038275 [Austropuccinia psidii MF-1]|uniref:Uncharacterized protein n=1 Tax=Austropuccinia psidii MF-1 TaxID=1389203 RepID=A0A9Q3DCK6_9BASI|nr:hypothetical protein [Austropuccinia psidii MF-1]